MSDKNQELAVVRQEPGALAVQQPMAPSISQMLQGVLHGNITSETAAVVERLAPLMKDEREHNAKMEFNRDFCALSAEMHRVVATKIIPGKGGMGVRSTYAPFEEIDSQLRPIAAKYGFAYSFSEGAFQQGKITKVCTVMHKGGHERSTPYSVRIGQGPPGCSESQADGSAHSYAKRGALCDAFNIVVTGMDNDARSEGKEITAAQAQSLRARVAATGTDAAKFLKFAGANDFESIMSGRYEELDQSLAKRERVQKQQQQQATAPKITAEQAAALNARLQATGCDVKDFLAAAGVQSCEEIPVSKLAIIEKDIARLEGK